MQLANVTLCLQARAVNVLTGRCLATQNTLLQLLLSFLEVLLSTSVHLLALQHLDHAVSR